MNGMCECDWKNCGHKGAEIPATDGELCGACLFVCEGEREDAEVSR